MAESEEVKKEGEKPENKSHESPSFFGEMQQMGEAVGGAFIELGRKMLPGMEETKNTKETQSTLLKKDQPAKVSKEEFLGVLKMITPGTNFRTALNNIVQGGKGALIVIENDEVTPLIDGGFRVNCRFTPQRLVELSKMDGAIILSKDLKKINHANVLLTPDSIIKTNETGTRHKAAERTAKQAKSIVVAVSERRHDITLFYKNIKHTVKYTAELLRQANEHIQLLEKHRELFDLNIEKLNRSEMRNALNLGHAVSVIQKGRIIQKISEDLRRYIVELGNEGTLLKTRLKELTGNAEKETDLVTKDYTKIGLKKSKLLLESLSYDELLDSDNIKKALAYEGIPKGEFIKGWRILSKTSLLEPDMALLIKETGHLGKLIHAEPELYKKILGEEKAQQFKEEIERIKLSY